MSLYCFSSEFERSGIDLTHAGFHRTLYYETGSCLVEEETGGGSRRMYKQEFHVTEVLSIE